MNTLYVTLVACALLGPFFVLGLDGFSLDGSLLIPLPMIDDDNSSLPMCPNKPGSNDSYFFVDPHNCSIFYQCSNGVPVAHVCPPGLQFNTNYSVCDRPENVECYEQPVQILYPFQHCSDGEILPNEEDTTCSSFIYCTIKNYDDVEGDVMLCPKGLRFNPEKSVCDYAENVVCNVQNSDEPTDEVWGINRQGFNYFNA